MKARGGRTLNFTCEKEASDMLNAYRANGYGVSELINYAISLLPEKLATGEPEK
jgi:hypothetical protein